MTFKAAFSMMLVAGITFSARAEEGSLGEPKMLIHGNYCGPGNNAPLPPIDALDAACARHDACTPDGAMPSRVCNLRLRREADAITRDPTQPPDLRALAGLVAAGAAMLENQNGAELAPARIQPGSSGSAGIRP